MPVSAEAARAKGGVWAALAEVALHHRVHMVPLFEHWVACGRNQPTVIRVQAEHSTRVALSVRQGGPWCSPTLYRGHIIYIEYM